MPKPSHEPVDFSELRERLLRAGIAPRYVRRYVNELADHMADLKVEEERAGRKPADAKSAALIRLGNMDDLAKAMTERSEFQSWCVRAPWAMFGLAPLSFLAGTYFVAYLILWSGWKIFLRGADTPFGVPVDGLANFYFGAGRLLYYTAPVLVGWGIGLIASRQRSKAIWPVLGFVLIALMGGTAQVHASRTAVSGLGHISMNFSLQPDMANVLFHALVIFSLTLLPWLIWRLQETHTVSAQAAIQPSNENS
jgi:hypothetical protein